MWLLISQCTICWKYLKWNYSKTIYVRGLLFLIKNKNANPVIVKYYYNEYNQQITKIILYIKKNIWYLWVGISETIRAQKYLLLLKYSLILNEYLENIKLNIVNEKTNIENITITKSEKKFNEWLAGLIDGDGCFGITQKEYGNCEITVGLEDEKMLNQIRNKFGGSLKLRSGSNSIRYRLSNKEGLIKLLNAVNGNIRNSVRLIQFHKLCNHYDIKIISPIKLDINNCWISGFFDADGTINYYYRNNDNRPQLFISITNKYLIDVEDIKRVLGGSIYFDKSKNGYYKWTITNEENSMVWYNYIKNNPSRSFKGNKIYMLKEFYKLYNIKAYKSNKDSMLYKKWLIFDKKWSSYSYKFK